MSNKKDIGRHSVVFLCPVYVASYASVVGKKEGDGPLGEYFDFIEEDPYFGQKTWEKAESKMQQIALNYALHKADFKVDDIKYLFGGDLLGQLMATSFGMRQMSIPIFGVYGACSTFGEALSLASMAIDGEFATNCAVITSSHFSGAEKQFRFPLDYGNQRPLSSTWTVTGAASMILSKNRRGSNVYIKGIITGEIEDYGIKDSMNMGGTMAPAVVQLIKNTFTEFGVDVNYFDKIITGDLGKLGKKILIDMLMAEGINISGKHMDCGIEIYDCENQDSHCGGSGCGCCACTLCSLIMKKLENGEYNRVLFIPTGALLSSTSFNEGDSIPAIAHGVIFERVINNSDVNK